MEPGRLKDVLTAPDLLIDVSSSKERQISETVEKAMKGAQVKADLTRPPGCTNEVSQMTSVKLFSTPFVTLGGQSGRGEIVQFK